MGHREPHDRCTLFLDFCQEVFLALHPVGPAARSRIGDNVSLRHPVASSFWEKGAGPVAWIPPQILDIWGGTRRTCPLLAPPDSLMGRGWDWGLREVGAEDMEYEQRKDGQPQVVHATEGNSVLCRQGSLQQGVNKNKAVPDSNQKGRTQK